jgi:hypothetical protein
MPSRWALRPATNDLDPIVKPDQVNAAALFRALAIFGRRLRA